MCLKGAFVGDAEGLLLAVYAFGNLDGTPEGIGDGLLEGGMVGKLEIDG